MRALKIIKLLADKLLFQREVTMRLGNEPKRTEHINAWVDEETMRFLKGEAIKRKWTLSQTIHWYLSKCAEACSTNKTYMSNSSHIKTKSSSAVTDEPCVQ